MIKSFEEFIKIKEEFIHSQSGKKLPNGNLSSIDEVYYEIGDGSHENAKVEDVTDDYDINKLNNQFDNFVSVVVLMDIDKNEIEDDMFYVIQGNDADGYTYSSFDSEEFDNLIH